MAVATIPASHTPMLNTATVSGPAGVPQIIPTSWTTAAPGQEPSYANHSVGMTTTTSTGGHVHTSVTPMTAMPNAGRIVSPSVSGPQMTPYSTTTPFTVPSGQSYQMQSGRAVSMSVSKPSFSISGVPAITTAQAGFTGGFTGGLSTTGMTTNFTAGSGVQGTSSAGDFTSYRPVNAYFVPPGKQLTNGMSPTYDPVFVPTFEAPLVLHTDPNEMLLVSGDREVDCGSEAHHHRGSKRFAPKKLEKKRWCC